MSRLVAIAIGGHAIVKDPEHQTVEYQYDAVCETAVYIADLIEAGYETVLTHGNGPQVGFILRRSEIAYQQEHLHFVPLVSCVADTQGALGYHIQQALENEFQKRNMSKRAVTVVTQVEVNSHDPSFSNPDKPIGSFYTEEKAKKLEKENPDWVISHEPGRGYRRVVPSPRPVRIIEQGAIETLLKQGFCVIAVGGGGIPVFRKPDGALQGVDAVIDKDYAMSLLASELGADTLLISTSVDHVYLNYGLPEQKALENISVSEAEGFIREGHFPAGSMLPKIKAAIDFLQKGGAEAIITSTSLLKEAVTGGAGTHIYRGDKQGNQ